MSNGFIGDRSWRKEATYSTGGVAAAGYPVTHLKHDEMARVWRSASTDLEDTQFKVVFPEPRPINVVVLCNHNLSKPNGRLRVKLWADPAATILVEDAGWKAAWEVVYDEDDPQASWDSGNAWDRTLSELDTRERPIDTPVYFANERLCYAVTVEIDDEENPAGYVQVGICEVAAGFFLPLNFDYGAQYGLVSRTQVVTAAGGVEYAQPETPDDVFIGQTSFIRRQDALSLFLEFQRRTDKHTFFWWSPDIDDTFNALRHSYLAKNSEIGLNTYAAFTRDSVPFSFKRVI